MQEQKSPVLIIAQSGRFLAQAATQAGYSVWVADSFGDQDTLSISQRWQQIPTFSANFLNILTKLTQGESCILIAGSGVELWYSLLNKLPPNIQVIGNSAQTIKTLKTPSLFFSLLNQLTLPHPPTQFDLPRDTTNWLVKSVSGLGGTHIQYLNQTADTDTRNQYFQYFVKGNSGSALFLANGKSAQLISINKQLLSPNKNTPFRLGSIETPWNISEKHRQQLKQAVAKITFATGLLGLNSIDFIISEHGELQLLEVNPRPSASAELIDSEIPLFQHHLNACLGNLPVLTIKQAATKTSLHYLYVNNDVTIPTQMIWPIECHDIPAPNTTVKKEQPLCTAIISTKSLQDIKQEIILQLNIDLKNSTDELIS